MQNVLKHSYDWQFPQFVIAENFGFGLCGHRGREKLLHVDEVSIPAGMACYITFPLNDLKELYVFLAWRK